MSARGSSDDPVIGEGDGSPEEMAEELRAAVREAVEQGREGAKQKEAELWERYRELTKNRRQRRER